jgi:hypothetical protein
MVASFIQWGNVAWVFGVGALIITGALILEWILSTPARRMRDDLTREERRAQYRRNRQRPLP